MPQACADWYALAMFQLCTYILHWSPLDLWSCTLGPSQTHRKDNSITDISIYMARTRQTQQVSASPKKRNNLWNNNMLLCWEKDPFQSVSHQTYSSCPPRLGESTFPNPHISLVTGAQAPSNFHDIGKKALIAQLWDVKINIYLSIYQIMIFELVIENVSSMHSFSLESLFLQISGHLCNSCLNVLQFLTVLLKGRQSSSGSITNSADRDITAPLFPLCLYNHKLLP